MKGSGQLYSTVASGIDSSEGGWYLAYDAGCGRCAAIGDVVRDTAGDQLMPVSLRDPVVLSWRVNAFGDSAPWTPMLFHIEGERVKGWTGKSMVSELVRLLGVRAALRLANEIGIVYAAYPTVNRRSFAKGLLGGLAAAGAIGAASANSVDEYEPPEEPISEEEAARADPCTIVYSGSLSTPTKALGYEFLKVRALPCTASADIAHIPCNTWVDRISYHDQPLSIYNSCVGEYRRRWYRVTYGGTTGYISSVFTTHGLGYDPGCC